MLTQLQQLTKQKLASAFTASTAVLLQSLMGSGKTYISMDFITDFLKESPENRVMIVVPTVALVEQFHATAQAFGHLVAIYHGELKYRYDERTGKRILMQQLSDIPHARICITLPDTFTTLVSGVNHYKYPKDWIANLLVMDEAHKNTSQASQNVRDFFTDIRVLGLTATPRREQNTPGSYLYDWYGDNLVIGATGDELIEDGRVVPVDIQSFDADETHIVDTWEARTIDSMIKSTMFVCRDTKHAIAVNEAFRARGHNSAIITAVGDKETGLSQQTPKQRQEIQSQFKLGKIDILISVDTLCEGFDAPRAQFLFILRRMTAEALYHQVVGRVIRSYTCPVTGFVKTAGYVLDFGGNHERYGSILDRVWTTADYAPASAHFIERNQIGISKICKAKYVMTTCRCCQHVYDLRKRFSCNMCGSHDSTIVTYSPRDIITRVYNLDSTVYSSQVDQIRKVLASKLSTKCPNYPIPAAHPIVFAREALNAMLGIALVDPHTGDYDIEHALLVDILVNGRKLNEALNTQFSKLSDFIKDRI